MIINHVWFDVEGTLTRRTPEFDRAHDQLRYLTYARVIGASSISDKLKREFDELYRVHGSNSAVFVALGKQSRFWQEQFNKLDISLYAKPDSKIFSTLIELKSFMPISLFSNLTRERIFAILSKINIDVKLFTYILSGDDIKQRKPHLEGFSIMIELSHIPADQILYVGDRIDVDVKPAKQLGMRTCLVWGESNIADISVQSIEQLLPITKSLRKGRIKREVKGLI